MCYQLKQLKKQPEKNSGLNGIRTHDTAIPVQGSLKSLSETDRQNSAFNSQSWVTSNRNCQSDLQILRNGVATYKSLLKVICANQSKIAYIVLLPKQPLILYGENDLHVGFTEKKKQQQQQQQKNSSCCKRPTIFADELLCN